MPPVFTSMVVIDSVWSMTRWPPDLRLTLRSSALPISSSTPCRSKIGRWPVYSSMAGGAAGHEAAANSSMRACEAALSTSTRSTPRASSSRRMRVGSGRSSYTSSPARGAHALFLHVLPQAGEVLDVFADLLASSRPARRCARCIRRPICCGMASVDQRLQARAFGLVFDARRHADAFAARHVDHEPRRQRDEGS